MRDKKILIITDSSGHPRPEPEELKYEDTWVSKLKNDYNVNQLSIGGATISELRSQVYYLQMFNPDLVFIESGMVDCVPRALRKVESDFFNSFSLTRWFLKVLLKPKVIRLFRKYRGITYTPIDVFAWNVRNIKNLFGHKLYWIGIVPATKQKSLEIPGIGTNIEKYNEELKRQLGENFIDLSHFSADCLMSDHIHLSKKGHDMVYEEIIKRIQ